MTTIEGSWGRTICSTLAVSGSSGDSGARCVVSIGRAASPPRAAVIGATAGLMLATLSVRCAWAQQTFTNFQAASLVIGQADFTSQNTFASSSTTPGANGVVISADGHLAIGSQDPGRVLIWNSIPTSNGQPANVVVGKTNFTDTTPGATAQTTTYCDGVMFSPSGKLIASDSGNHRVLVVRSPYVKTEGTI